MIRAPVRQFFLWMFLVLSGALIIVTSGARVPSVDISQVEFFSSATVDSLSLENIQQQWPKLDSQKVTARFKAPAKGSVVWIRLVVPANQETRFLGLSLRQPELLEYVQFRQGKLISSQKAGLRGGTQNVNLFSYFPIFFIQPDKEVNTENPWLAEDEIFLRVKTRYFAGAEAAVYSWKQGLAFLEMSRLGFYLYLGAALVLLIHQLAMFSSFRRRYSLYYSLYIGAALTTVLFSRGCLDYFMPAESKGTGFYQAIWLSMGAATFFLARFSYHFLENPVNWQRRLIQLLTVFSALIAVVGVVQLQAPSLFGRLVLIYDFSLVAFSVLYPILLIGSFFTGSLMSGYMILSWLPMSVAMIYNTLGSNLIAGQSQILLSGPDSFVLLALIFELTTIGVVTYHRLKQVNEELHAAQIQNRQKQAMETLLKSLSHDLGNYFFKISGNIEILKRQQLPENMEKRVNSIKTCVASMTDLLNAVRQWLSSGGSLLFIKLEPQSLTQMVRETLDLFQAQLEAKSLTVQYQDDDDWLVLVDQQAFKTQVLNNLISNAIKFSPRGGLIKLTVLEEDQDQLTLLVKDSGAGFTPEQVEQFVERGGLKSTLGTESEKGTGFGLQLAHLTMSGLGGSMQLLPSDPVDPGARFVLVIKKSYHQRLRLSA